MNIIKFRKVLTDGCQVVHQFLLWGLNVTGGGMWVGQQHKLENPEGKQRKKWPSEWKGNQTKWQFDGIRFLCFSLFAWNYNMNFLFKWMGGRKGSERSPAAWSRGLALETLQWRGMCLSTSVHAGYGRDDPFFFLSLRDTFTNHRIRIKRPINQCSLSPKFSFCCKASPQSNANQNETGNFFKCQFKLKDLNFNEHWD